MRLELSKALKNPGQPMPFELSEQFEPINVAGEELRFTKPVTVSGKATYTGEDFFLTGSIHAEYIATCCRCLKDVPSTMEIVFTEEYAKQADENHPDRYLYQGETIELGQMAGDLISLNAPMRHLCSEDCQGLCPVCGVDRNKTKCDCPQGDRQG